MCHTTGSSHLDGSRQVQLAHEEMGAEISNLLIILGEDEAASLGADWNQIVTTNGASLTGELWHAGALCFLRLSIKLYNASNKGVTYDTCFVV